MSQGNEKLNPCDIGKSCKHHVNTDNTIQDEIEVSSDISGKETKDSNQPGTTESFVPQTYRAKLFGNIPVSEPRGDFICERSLGLLKAQLLTSKSHKKRIKIRVDTNGISVLGSRNSTVHHIHKFENITFIWTDPCDLQSCGIIVRQNTLGENVHEFYGYKLYQNTPKLIRALKQIYSNLDLMPSNEGVSNSSENPNDTKSFETKEENDSDLIQLVDISDSINSPNEIHQNNKKYPTAFNKEIGSNWTTFDDHFGNKDPVWTDNAPVDLWSPISNNQQFFKNNKGFFSPTNTDNRKPDLKHSPISFTGVTGSVPYNTPPYIKSHSTTANVWPTAFSGIQSFQSKRFPLDDPFSCNNVATK
uniref:PID domain-containing protein n=1 Tax=Trichobilharzia regenti TaxID=157069 RepID=A0AA85JBS1_TRIRE|nr:unnamed protein product [Trichobilharzia regenti]